MFWAIRGRSLRVLSAYRFHVTRPSSAAQCGDANNQRSSVKAKPALPSASSFCAEIVALARPVGIDMSGNPLRAPVRRLPPMRRARLLHSRRRTCQCPRLDADEIPLTRSRIRALAHSKHLQTIHRRGYALVAGLAVQQLWSGYGCRSTRASITHVNVFHYHEHTRQTKPRTRQSVSSPPTPSNTVPMNCAGNTTSVARKTTCPHMCSAYMSSNGSWPRRRQRLCGMRSRPSCGCRRKWKRREREEMARRRRHLRFPLDSRVRSRSPRQVHLVRLLRREQEARLAGQQ